MCEHFVRYSVGQVLQLVGVEAVARVNLTSYSLLDNLIQVRPIGDNTLFHA